MVREKAKKNEVPEVLRDSLGRIRYPHKYKYGKPDEPITKADLEKALEDGYFASPLKHKSYLVITALIGSRKTEALEILKEDIRQSGDSLFVDIPAKKHGYRGGKIELPLNWLGMDLVLRQWMKTRKGRKIWSFSPQTAWRIVKRVFPKKSPHHLRWTVITELREMKDARLITTDEIKSWTGIKRDSTIEGYGLKTQAGIHRVSQILDQRQNK
ncbi:MAG: hypothetical protein KAW52_05205 [candidate division Zixibacteria bacterium]|nr:hypothetical protein [candidate division Zixibacteria bacterium]